MLLGSICGISLIVAALRTIGDPLWVLPLYFLVSCVELTLLALALLFVMCRLVDLEKPQEKDNAFYRWIMYLYVDALITLFKAKVHTAGLEKTPQDGRFLLVCNHQHMADVGILISKFKKSKIAFISKQENRNMPVIGKFMYRTSSQTLDREDDRQALRVILKCIQMIKDNEVSVAVFPEGTRSKDGKVHAFRNGGFKIAQKANVPIVVCTINGTGDLFRNLKKLKTSHIHLHLVDMISPEELKGKTTAEIGQRVYETMIADLGEEFRMEVAQNT